MNTNVVSINSAFVSEYSNEHSTDTCNNIVNIYGGKSEKKYIIPNNIREGNHNHTQQKVLPIKDSSLVDEIFDSLLHSGRYGFRNASIFALNIAIGRRSSDILRLRVKDVYDFNTHDIKLYMSVKESKTGKSAQDMPVNEVTRNVLRKYFNRLADTSPDAYFFPSQKKNADGSQRPLNVTSMNEIYKWNTEYICSKLEDPKFTHISSYSCRKTYGYNLYKYCMEHNGGMTSFGVHVLDYLQSLYNHSSRLITLRYIGAWDDLSLGMANAVAMQYTMSVEGIR